MIPISLTRWTQPKYDIANSFHYSMIEKYDIDPHRIYRVSVRVKLDHFPRNLESWISSFR